MPELWHDEGGMNQQIWVKVQHWPGGGAPPGMSQLAINDAWATYWHAPGAVVIEVPDGCRVRFVQGERSSEGEVMTPGFWPVTLAGAGPVALHMRVHVRWDPRDPDGTMRAV